MENRATKDRSKVFAYLCKFADQNGYMPTQSEIREGCDIGSNHTVRKILSELENDGLLQCAYTKDGRQVARAMWIPQKNVREA